jgi:hypothetical protein
MDPEQAGSLKTAPCDDSYGAVPLEKAVHEGMRSPLFGMLQLGVGYPLTVLGS